jgi:hypothetical protein
MTRSSAALLLLLVTGCGGSQLPNPPDVILHEGFETGLDGWQRDYELPWDPNRPGEVVEWSIETSAGPAAEGLFSVRFFVDGRQDDGTIWLVKALDMQPGTTYDVDLQLQLWSESESFNTVAAVAAYAGPQPPATESDFDVSQPANLAAGWVDYGYLFRATSDGAGRLWVAFGITVLWETELEYFIDDVRIGLLRAGAP